MFKRIIMMPEDIRRTLARIAHEVIERTKSLDSLVLVGLHTRGVPLAERLSVDIERFSGQKIPVGALDITLYRDDLSAVKPQAAPYRTYIPADIRDRVVVLVDDVLYTGRSIRAAMDALIDFGRPQLIQLAVLIDRGHRELPIRADYVGKNVPTSRQEEVQVRLEESDGVDEVAIVTLPEEQLLKRALRKELA